MCFQGGVARECISKKFNFVDWYELDPEVVEVCNKHLGDIGKKSTEKNSSIFVIKSDLSSTLE